MPWPQATDYNAAVQNPGGCFDEPNLREGQVDRDVFGLPRPHSGNFADVYQVQCPDGQSWAVKCFTREIPNLQSRYLEISKHLEQNRREFMVDFRYLDRGIRIGGVWYPILKMRWVEGLRLNEFVAEHIDRPIVLERLANMWLRLAQELREIRLAHGDLQHGNVMLVPGARTGFVNLRLVDYDGLYVPALADTPSGEVGHPNYQHPQRIRDGAYSAETDRFSHLVIYTALRCLRLGGKDLWDRNDNSENLIFRESDFRNPAQSRLLRELWSVEDGDVHALVGRVILASQDSLVELPLLDEVVLSGGVKRLSAAQEERTCGILKLPIMAHVGFGKATSLPADTSESRLDWLEANGSRSGTTESFLPSAPWENTERLETAPGATQTAGDRSDPQPMAVLEKAGETAIGRVTEATKSQRAAGTATAVPDGRPEANPPALSQGGLGMAADFVLARPWVVPVAGAGLLLVVVSAIGLLLPREVNIRPVLSEPPQLVPMEDVTLLGGESLVVPISIENTAEFTEPLLVQVDGLPDAVSVKPLRLVPPRQWGKLELTASLLAKTQRCPLVVSLRQEDGTRICESRFTLSVVKRPLPTLRVPAPIRLMPGKTQSVAFLVDRNGSRDAVKLSMTDLPPGVAASGPVALEIGADKGVLVLSAEKDADEASQMALVTLWVRGIAVDEQRLTVSVVLPVQDRKSP